MAWTFLQITGDFTVKNAKNKIIVTDDLDCGYIQNKTFAKMFLKCFANVLCQNICKNVAKMFYKCFTCWRHVEDRRWLHVKQGCAN